MEALNAHPPKGVSPRLTAEQKAQIPELLAKGAEAYGFRGDVWTASRVAEIIKRTFGVRSHRDHVGKLMREAGWSRQKPVERASQRNLRGAQKMVGGALAGQQKKAEQDTATIIWVDEAGFYLLPMAVRTWAPRGQTPLLRVKWTRDHRIARSAVSRSMGDCSCKCAPTRMMRKRSWASCGCSYARVPARSCSSGMARLSTALTRSRIFSSEGRPNVCIWNNFQAMPLI
jgi:hypothetical protein